MQTRLLSPREGVIWAIALLFVASLLVVTRFTSADPDSALYASISGRLTQEPASRWIAPEWWGFWPETKMEGLFREHPSGVFVVPAAVARLGIPGEQAAYVVGIGYGLAALLLIGVLVSKLTSPGEARASLILLQLMPVAFLFRIRANHEYPMLVALLITLVSVEGVRRSWWWVAGVALGLTLGLLVKGVFVVLVGMGAGLWILLNPSRSKGTTSRAIAACVIGAAITAGIAVLYDAAYLRVTGDTFWAPYWRRQLGPVTIASPLDDASTLAGHLAFYVSRLLWFPAPWSIALVIAGWRLFGQGALARWRSVSETARRGLLFAILFASLAVLVLSPSSRFAERYAFSAAFMIGGAGTVAAYRIWPSISRVLDRLDERIPALPATTWLTLMLLRIVLGPWLPRIP